MYVCHTENWSAGTCWDNSFVNISRMYTMMEEHMKSTFNIHRHHILNISPSFSQSKKGSAGCWSVQRVMPRPQEAGSRRRGGRGWWSSQARARPPPGVSALGPGVGEAGFRVKSENLDGKNHKTGFWLIFWCRHLCGQFSHWVPFDWPLW